MEYSKIIAEAEGRFSNPHPQNFPVPWWLMKYIQKECSLEVYQKLTKTCKYFYASQPWMVIEFSENYSKFRRTLNQGLKRNFKIWIAGEPLFHGSRDFLELSSLSIKIPELLHSIRFPAFKNLLFLNRKLSYSDYIMVTEVKSLTTLCLENTSVTSPNDVNEVCLLDDLLKPLKNVQTFIFAYATDSDYYLRSAKRLVHLAVPKNLRELEINEIPEYISFEYFHLFLKKNPSISTLGLNFRTTDVNNTFISDVQSFYSETLTYETTDYIPQIKYEIFIGNLKIEACFYKICKNCNQGVAIRFLETWFCPSNAVHWICEACFNAFQFGGPCTFCLAGV